MIGNSLNWKVRYTVLSVLFITWIVSFMDRMIMSVAIPYIADDFDLSPSQIGLVMSSFFAAYSISQIPGGMLADRFGVRRVATIAMLWWSAFTALTGFAASFVQMLIVRFVFGLGEGVFPACAFKTIAVWFPRKERATANAIKMAAGPLGAALSPLFVVGVMSIWGWHHVFYLMFFPGIIITLLFWIFVADKPSDNPRVSQEEQEEIDADETVSANGGAEKAGLREAIREPHILKYFFALFAYDIAYWGFTTWLPTYLVKERGFSMVEMGVATSLPFFAGATGCVLGGWLSDRFFSQNRKMPILSAQLISALLLYLTYSAHSFTILLICQTIAGFCLNFFFASFWALPMNTVPRRLMGVASGFINMAGQIAAFLSPLIIGFLVELAGGGFSLTFAFMIGALLISSAIVVITPATVDRRNFLSDALHQ